MDATHVITHWLWPAAVGAVPAAAVVALVCRTGWCRASTRHALWLMVLACFLVTPLVPRLRLPAAGAESPGVAADPVTPPSAFVDVPATPGIDGSALAGWADRTESRLAELARAVETPAGLEHRGDGATRRPGPTPSSATPMPRSDMSGPVGTLTSPPRERAAYAPPAAVLTYAAPLPALAVAGGESILERAAAPSSWTTRWIDAAAWKRWTPKVQALRDAFATLPPVPASLWIGGGGLILAVIAGRTWRFRRVLARSSPAPAGVRLMVQQAAREIGLKRTPAVLMTGQRISPMVWCGLHCRLVLPGVLWDELDDLGRRAVILHELAHLRRRDHWVRWAEMAASVAYWWHPVVWWVRGRLRDEADLCCDAWVTALLPRERRAYAMALVSTQSYLSRNSFAPPSMGLGVMTPSAERFARRLTMVMKARPNPRLSALGIFASLALGVVASTSASLWACPPEDEKPVTKVSQPEKPAKASKSPKAAKEAEQAAVAAQAAAAAEYSAAIAAQAAATTARAQHEAAVAAGRAQHGAAAAEALTAARRADHEAVARVREGQPAGRYGGDSDARIRELEARLERLDAQIERLQEMLERSRTAPRGPLSTAAPALRGGTQIVTPGAPLVSVLSAPARAGLGGTTAAGGVALATPMPSPRGGAMTSAAPRAPQPPAPADVQPGGDIVRSYPISGGKLEALWNLMSREDVPVFVSQDENGIAVHGSEAQHRAFKAFIQIINPEGDGGAAAEAQERYRIEVQNLDALRGDQDVARVQDQLHRHAESLAQRHANLEQRMLLLRSLNDQQRQEIVAKVREAEKRAAEIKVRRLNKADDAKLLLEQLHKDSQTIIQAQRAAAEQNRDQMGRLESRADGLERDAEALEQRASDLADQADELAEQAGDLQGDARAAAQKHVRELQAQSKDLARQARDMNKQAEVVRKQIDALEADADACQEAADQACDDCGDDGEEADCPPCPEAAEPSEPLAAAAPTAPMTEVPVVAGVPTPPPAEPAPVLPPALPH